MRAAVCTSLNASVAVVRSRCGGRGGGGHGGLAQAHHVCDLLGTFLSQRGQLVVNKRHCINVEGLKYVDTLVRDVYIWYPTLLIMRSASQYNDVY